MATPPKLPPDAFKQPGQEMESPWDVQTSAPAPKTRKPLALPTWAGRYPIAAHDHSTQLDMDAAVNEFGLKMPREQAEDEAYRQYLYHPQRGQHAQAALHHLRGMKSAHAGGDMDAARNHSLMLGLHAKALGKQPHELARDLQSQMQNLAPMNKFKAHRGDAFAAQTPPPQAGTGVIASSPPPQLNKREQEVLRMLYLMSNAVLAKSEKPVHFEASRDKITGSVSTPCSKSFPQTSAQTRTNWKHVTCKSCLKHKSAEKTEKGEVVGEIHGTAPKKDLPAGRKRWPSDEIGNERWRRTGVPPMKPKKEDAKKAEMKSSSKHCKCVAYKFPHRHGGGKCKESK